MTMEIEMAVVFDSHPIIENAIRTDFGYTVVPLFYNPLF